MLSDINKVRCYGPSTSRPVISICIVTQLYNNHNNNNNTTLYSTQLSGYIQHIYNNNNNNKHNHLTIHQCHDTLSLIQHTLSLDLLIVCMDTSRLDCADWARKMITQCSEDLRPGRVVLVNFNFRTNYAALDQAVPPDTIVELKRDLKVHYLNGGNTGDADLMHVARRIKIIMDKALGIYTGIPYPIV